MRVGAGRGLMMKWSCQRSICREKHRHHAAEYILLLHITVGVNKYISMYLVFMNTLSSLFNSALHPFSE